MPSGIEPAVKRHLILAAVAVGSLTAGILAAPGHAPLRLLTASSSEAPPSGSVTLDEPTTEAPAPPTTEAPTPTTSTTAPEGHHEAPPTTVPEEPHHHEPPTTVPEEPRHESPSTTSTTAAQKPDTTAKLTMACTTAGTSADTAVHCRWTGVPAGTTKQVIMRERPGTSSQPIAYLDDVAQRSYDDPTADAGVTYSYRVSAYGPDSHFITTSNPVRITPGAGGGTTTTTSPTQLPRFELQCVPTGEHAVHCSWAEGPAATVRYRLIRMLEGQTSRVVAETGLDHRSADDTNVPTGSQRYYVVALDSSGKTIGGGYQEIQCCSSAETSR